MIKAALAVALLINVSVDPGIVSPDGERAPANYSRHEKAAILHPLIDSATACVARVVGASPKLGEEEITELIVESFKDCVDPVRAMIDAHDTYYGPGTGEEFFMGPYLDALPAVVMSIVGSKAHHGM